MAGEKERACGYRKIGGLYLEGEYVGVSCDRLPMPLTTCPVCGGGIRVGRGFTEINPRQLWGFHQSCSDKFRPCFVCDPRSDPAFIMLVGERYYKTPADFNNEAREMGISKRIPFVPKNLQVGKTVVYLAHKKAAEVHHMPADQRAFHLDPDEIAQDRLLDAESVKMDLGIFSAFIPQRIVQIVRDTDLQGPKGEKLRKSLERRGIVPVPVPAGDPDHL